MAMLVYIIECMSAYHFHFHCFIVLTSHVAYLWSTQVSTENNILNNYNGYC